MLISFSLVSLRMEWQDFTSHLSAIEDNVRRLLDENSKLKEQVAELQMRLTKRDRLSITSGGDSNQHDAFESMLPQGANQIITVKKLNLSKSVNVVNRELKDSKTLVARARGGRVNRVPECDQNFRAAVRGKDQREVLDGFDCSQCECFYKTTGHIPNLCDKHSKHKYFKPPPNTPAGFWDPWSQDDE